MRGRKPGRRRSMRTDQGSRAAAGLLVAVLCGGSIGCGQVGEGGSADAQDWQVVTADGHEGLLHGRIVTGDGDVYEGRIRFGGDEEATWLHQFNGVRRDNPWVAHVPADEIAGDRFSWRFLGMEFSVRPDRTTERPFVVRMGDITRIDAHWRDLRVTLRSGSVVRLDRYEADDFADGVRVWDAARGITDLSERTIRSIEFFPPQHPGAGPLPLHGTVRTATAEFNGFIQWERESGLESDQLRGRNDDAEIALAFSEISSVVRRPGGGAVVATTDGREVMLSSATRGRQPHRGLYVDDPRFGRVLVSWEAFERVDFTPGGPGPAHADFAPGHPLKGTVVTRSGHRMTGRLVYDLDESESTETLDAPAQGVDYMIPFGLIARIDTRGSADNASIQVMLRSGEELRLARGGDLADSNGGMLVFQTGSSRPAYVAWADLERIELEHAGVAGVGF